MVSRTTRHVYLFYKVKEFVCMQASSRQTLMHVQTWGAYQRISLEDKKDKITLSYEPKTSNGNKMSNFFSVCSHDKNVSKSRWKGRWNP